MNAELIIDPEYEAMCPPLTEDEYRQLEENILSEGLVLMPLIVWDGTIIDGHNRYKIAQAHPGIEYQTRERQFENRYEAIAWICKNQLGRRNLTPQDKKYLVGARYEAEKMAMGASDGFRGNQHTNLVTGQNDPLPDNHVTRHRIATESGVSDSYVKRAAPYAKGVNAAEEVLPGIKKELRSGTIMPKDAEVAAVARAPAEKRRQLAEKLRVTKDNSASLRSSKDKLPASATSKAARQELQEIRDIYTDMLPDDASAPTSEDSVLETLHGAVTDMIRVCDTLFADFPRLLEDSTYKARVIEIMQEPKSYILQIEGVRQ